MVSHVTGTLFAVAVESCARRRRCGCLEGMQCRAVEAFSFLAFLLSSAWLVGVRCFRGAPDLPVGWRKEANALHSMGALSTGFPPGCVLGGVLLVVGFCSRRSFCRSAYKLRALAHSLAA